MADNTPNNESSGTPPKPSESGKIQPKKETVRIKLPPKPSGPSTVKMPGRKPEYAAPSGAQEKE
ncbi:MAG: hypothetical protein K9N52_11000, partial [Verrucomicrobia bacterium]|nr:hypothetical protein [Verrucomicrobiota bacterium]